MSFQFRRLILAAAARERMHGVAWKAFCGCFAAARVGRICLDRSLRTSLAGDASSSGPVMACGTKLGVGYWSSLIGAVMSIGSKASPAARSHRQKRGDLIGPTKRGKGTKLMLLVDGAGLPLAVDIH